MPIVRVGPAEGFRIVPGQPQLVGWPVDLADQPDWGVVTAVYGNTDSRKVVALGVRAAGVIHLMRWQGVEMDSQTKRLRVQPAVAWREPFIDGDDAPMRAD
jgi:hypothetical protein